jgi:hypothetical protein
MKRDIVDDSINSAAAAANRDRDVLAGYRAHAASFGALARISLLLPEPWAGEVDDYDAIVKAVEQLLMRNIELESLHGLAPAVDDDQHDVTVLSASEWLEKTALTMEEANHLWQERLCPLHSGCVHEICSSIRFKLDAVRLGYFPT